MPGIDKSGNNLQNPIVDKVKFYGIIFSIMPGLEAHRPGHSHHPDVDIRLSQPDINRRAVWEEADPSEIDVLRVEQEIETNGFYLLPQGTTVMLRIGYQDTATDVEYLDVIGETLDKDVECRLLRLNKPVPRWMGPSVVLVLDSADRREASKSGIGRQAAGMETEMARAFLHESKRREAILKHPHVRLDMGSVMELQLIARASKPQNT